MLGISAAEVLADLVIGRCPEAAEILGDLDRPVVGSEDMEKHGNSTSRQPGSIGPPEQVLKPRGQDGGPSHLIGESDRAAVRQGE